MRRAFIAIFTFPFFPALVAFVGAVAGLLASIYSTELKEAASTLIANWPAASPVTLVGIVFVLFFVLFGLQQMARNMLDGDANTSVLDESARLKQLVERLETLPPDGFLQGFQELYRGVARLPLLALAGPVTKSNLENSIRTVVTSVASLAHKYDGSHGGPRYSANLMLCIEQFQLKHLSKDEREALSDRLIFCPDLPEPKLDGVAAVLDLVPEFSSNYDEADPGKVMPTIALPVPDVQFVDLGPEQGRRFKLLPGASFVAARHQYVGFESPAALIEWCREKADLTQATVSEIRQYFHDGAGSELKSFVSIPICISVPANAPMSERFGGLAQATNGGGMREECLAVLNIDSTAESILGENGHALFVPLIEPFCQVLSMLLAAYGSQPWADAPDAIDAIDAIDAKLAVQAGENQ